MRKSDSAAFNPPPKLSLIMMLDILWSVCAHSCVLEAWLWKVICREGGILCIQSYSLLLLAFLKLPTIPLIYADFKQSERSNCIAVIVFWEELWKGIVMITSQWKKVLIFLKRFTFSNAKYIFFFLLTSD